MNEEVGISLEAWADWKVHPVTKAVQRWAARGREDLRRSWELGKFSHENPQASAQLNAKALGMAQVLEMFESLELADFGGNDGE